MSSKIPSKTTKRSKASRPSASQNDKVGDSSSAARRFAGKGDFGAPEAEPIERAYASAATRAQDKGGRATDHSGADGGRTSGVGGNDSGIGSSSGGDVDTTIVGFGTGGSTVSASGPSGHKSGPGDIAKSGDHLSNPSHQGRSAKMHRGGRRQRRAMLRESTVNRSGGDIATTGAGQGSAAISNPQARDDDSFAGEVSNDEAAGADNSPSDNR